MANSQRPNAAFFVIPERRLRRIRDLNRRGTRNDPGSAVHRFTLHRFRDDKGAAPASWPPRKRDDAGGQ